MATNTPQPNMQRPQTGNNGLRFCSYCGTKLDEGARFCKNCGEVVGQTTTTSKNNTTTCSEQGSATYSQDGKSSYRSQNDASNEPNTERRTYYAGEIHKCPSCGEVLKSFEANCPTCGYEIRTVKGTSSVRELSLRLEAIEANRDSTDAVQKRIGNRRVGHAERSRIEDEIKSKLANQKATLISTFPIPTTKEDLFEFLVLASSNINMEWDSSSSGKTVSDAWEAKFEQAYEKAKLSFGDTQDFAKIQPLYQEKKSKIKQRKRKSNYLLIGFLAFIFIPFILLILNPPSTDPVDIAENERLKVIAEEVYEALADENYVLARAKAASLTYLESHDSYTKKWDKTRKELLALIDAAENGAEIDIPETNKSSSFAEETKEPEQSFSVDNMDIPPDFISGYEEAEFSKYNSPASENGLGGSQIYIVGTLEKTEILDAEGTPLILGYIADDEGNMWLVKMHIVPVVTETHFNAAVGTAVVCTVVYDGYSGKLQMPSTTLNELLILEDGTIFNGMQKLLTNKK